MELQSYTIYVFMIGILNYLKQKKMIAENEKNIGDYKNEYYGK